MPQETVTTEEFFAKLSAVGEKNVRERLALGDYGAPGVPPHRLAEEWLRTQEQKRQNRRDHRIFIASLVAAIAATVAAVASVIALF